MRQRYLFDGFFKNRQLAKCSPESRLLFMGLWCMGDKKGFVVHDVEWISANIFPYDSLDVQALLEELASCSEPDGKPSFVRFCRVKGFDVIHIINFLKYQRPHHDEKDFYNQKYVALLKKQHSISEPLGGKKSNSAPYRFSSMSKTRQESPSTYLTFNSRRHELAIKGLDT